MMSYNLTDVNDMLWEWVEYDSHYYDEFDGDCDRIVETILLDIQNQITYKTVCEMLHALVEQFGDIEITNPIAMYASMKGRELFEEKHD